MYRCWLLKIRLPTRNLLYKYERKGNGEVNVPIGLAQTQIVTAVLRNQLGVLSISTVLAGDYGINDVCLYFVCRFPNRRGADCRGEAKSGRTFGTVCSAAVLKKLLLQYE